MLKLRRFGLISSASWAGTVECAGLYGEDAGVSNGEKLWVGVGATTVAENVTIGGATFPSESPVENNNSWQPSPTPKSAIAQLNATEVPHVSGN
jgi:hypothetical protein